MVIAAVPLAAPVDDHALTPAERGLCDAAASDERRRELRAGRAAFHLALSACTTRPASLLHDAAGRPRLEPPSDWFVSIAHDGDWALAAVSNAAVGIDLVPLSRADRVRHVVSQRLATHRARPLAAGSEQPFDEALLLWTAWEALGKRSGGGVLAGPMRRSLKVERSVEGATSIDGDDRLRWWLHEGHVLCVAGRRPGA